MENPASTINTTAPGDASFFWKAEPTERGTFGILSFCFSTLIICVWSTLHFDIPTTRHTPTYQFFIHVSWMAVALIAPEALLCAAINQRIDAEILVKKAAECLPSSQEVAKPGIFARLFQYCTPKRVKLGDVHLNFIERRSQLRKQRFGLVHAFYVAMGGFVFDMPAIGETVTTTEESPSKPSTNTLGTRYVLTPAAFTYIMEHFPDIIPDISEDSITDRSQSSSLSKAILIVQVGWFCTDCVSRLIQRLPLSLLEVSTAAHAFCTLLTYFVWWSKPLNIAEGTLMTGEEAQGVHALLICSEEEYNRALEMARTIIAVASPVDTNDAQQDRVALAANALRRLLPTSNARPPMNPFRHRSEWSAPGSLLADAMRSRPYELASIAFSPILYGLVHFLAWNDHFPKPLERTLWRVASVLVTLSGVLWVMLGFVTDYFMSHEGICSSVVGTILAILVMLAVPLTYVLASGFLVGESFRQLFFLGPAAYQVASLSYYWPHFS